MLSLWVVFAVLAGIAVFSVLWPLSRSAVAADSREMDVAFYKAQSAEIDRDRVRGIIGAEEAETAQTEAARRLMAAAQRVGGEPREGSAFAVRFVALATLLFIPAIALGLYGKIGAPNLPDMPLEARLKASPASMDLPTAIAKIERHLAEHPDDGRGYEVLAPTYLRLGRPDEAVRAFSQAIALLGPSADRYAGLGEAQVYIGNGVVTADAKGSFDKALALDPKSPRAGYYLGLAAQQDGDKPKALTIWRKLVADSPPDAPWLQAIQMRIAELSGTPPAQDVSAPSQGGLAAAIQSMPEDQRQSAIHGMVDRLAERLKTNGADLDGWLRLVRAYRVLDEQGKAKGALADARHTFAADAAATKRLDALAHELGLEG